METTVAQLRFRNSQAHISMLNTDVLSQIFLLNSHLDFDHPHIPSITVRNMTHVAHSWRELILGYPLIWATSLDFADTIPWIRIVLSRAGQTPLTVMYPPISDGAVKDRSVRETWRFRRPSMMYLHNRWAWISTRPEDRDDEKFNLALSLLPSCRLFSVVVRDSGHLWRVEAKISATICAALHLETLALSLHTHFKKLDIFKEGGLQIKNVYFSNCCPQFGSPVFQNLSELSVEGPPAIGFSSVEWLHLLARLNRLEKLWLYDCFKEENSVTTEGIRAAQPSLPVSFPLLRSLKICGEQAPCTNFIAHIDIPPACDMRIDVRGVRDNTYLAPMTKAIVNKLAACVAIQKVHGLSVDLWPDQVLFTNIHHTLDDTILSILWIIDRQGYRVIPAGITSLFWAAFQAIGADVTDLHLDLRQDCTQPMDFFFEVFGHLSNANHLRISDNRTIKYLLILNVEFSRLGRQLLPALSTMLLYELEIGTQQSVDDFVTFLYQRHDYGMPIQRIELKCCCGASVQTLVGELQILGIQVQWDKEHV